MSDAYVQVAPDSTGKKIQTFENTVSGNLVESQAVVLVDSTGAVITPVTGAGGSNTQVQYNNSNAFGGISGATSDGTKMTLATPNITTGFTIDGAAVAGAQIIADGANYGIASSIAVVPSLRFKAAGITILTSGTPADIASFSIPSWITFWTCVTTVSGGSSGTGQIMCHQTVGATMAGANFIARDTSGGGGNAITNSIGGPGGAGGITCAGGALTFRLGGHTIFIRQTSNSANAATADFFLELTVLT